MREPSRKAWVASVLMGLGHLRAAFPLKDLAHEEIILYGSRRFTPPAEYRRWKRLRRIYYLFSRAGRVPLMVRQELNFRRPLRFGDSVSLEGWVERIGESSVTLWLEMRNAATGEICCDNRQVMVITDPKAHAPVPIPGPFRAQLERHR